MSSPTLNFREFVTTHQPADWELAHMYHHDKMKVRELAQKTGHSVGSLYRKIRQSGGYPNRQQPDHQTILDLDERGFEPTKIAELVGRTASNVRYVLSKKAKNE